MDDTGHDGGCAVGTENEVARELSVSVRALVEHVHRAGDLEMSSFGAGHEIDAINAHQTVQASRPPEYTPEATITHRIESGDAALTVRGRMDGVYRYGDSAVIDEIKTTRRSLDEAAGDDNPLHWAQVICYAAMYAREEQITGLAVQLTYCQLPSGDIREIRRDISPEELDRFFTDTVAAYLSWAANIALWRDHRDDSIQTLAFPFGGYRPGQRELARDVWGAIRAKATLIAEAPTGTGKTMAVLFPAVKALGGGLADRLFYLTARTTGRTAAESALDRLRDTGLALKSLTLTAKDKLCPVPDAACTAAECPYAEGFYDRLGPAREEAFRHDGWTRELVSSLADGHRVCPFEFSLELALWADCVICDYNYAFDPRVHLRRFFQEDSGTNVFLVDEAHNLVDRSREMFSAEVARTPVLVLRKRLKSAQPGIYRALGTVNRRFLDARKRCVDGGVIEEAAAPRELALALRGFTAAAERWLERNEPAPFREELLDCYFAATTFLRVMDRYDATYTSFTIPDGRDLTVRLFCLDPAPQMREALERCAAAIFFSATLTPLGCFRTVLGLDDAFELRLGDPFPPPHRCVMTAGGVSTRYRHRERTREEVAAFLGELARARIGNYLFYFPSYEYLASVREAFAAGYPDIETIVQERFMSEDERDRFVARFTHEPSSTLAGFAVMGGVFGEGIDLTGERLTGAAIVGVGLPGISPEREAIRAYMDRAAGDGFDIAYRFPGINRVLQAAGRVIRTDTDRGIILLVDERFTQTSYRRLLPPEWRPSVVGGPADAAALAEAFWAKPGLDGTAAG